MSAAEPEPYRDPLWEHVQAWLEIELVPRRVWAVLHVSSGPDLSGYVAHARVCVGEPGRMSGRAELDDRLKRAFARLIPELDKTLHA